MESFDFPVHEMRDMGKNARFAARQYESKVGLATARRAFLERLKEALQLDGEASLGEGVSHLRAALKQQVAVIQRAIAEVQALTDILGLDDYSQAALGAFGERLEGERQHAESVFQSAILNLESARQLRTEWVNYQGAEPWWMGFLAAFGMSGPRYTRNRAFCASAVLRYAEVLDEEFGRVLDRNAIDGRARAILEQAESAHATAQVVATNLADRARQLNASVEYLNALTRGKGVTQDTVQHALDLGPRYTAFKLATHYWEGRFLLQLDEHFLSFDEMKDSKAPARLLAQYRRLAKLHPCFVATLYTLPSKFIAWRSNTEAVALRNEIDLLIVDEAGQVSPEIGAPSFALAKRALVVGDVDQIEPIWQVPSHIDGANAMKAGIVTNESSLALFREGGMSAANGSVMRLAQRATPFAKCPERGRGMFLSEHRRCWAEIIEMCNVLVYGGRLRPRRADDGRRAVWPSVGFVHIPGTDRVRGGSRDNPNEAAAIARWLAERKKAIEEAYNGEELGKLVAVVTPFAAQSRRVHAALRDALGKQHGITVGTVHSLQGAERRLVLFSPTYGLGTKPGTTFLDRNRSILNVAISRAQDAFMLFGNMHLFQPSGHHPCAVIGQMLFASGAEITGIPASLLVPGSDLPPGQLITTLEGHRGVLQEAMSSAQRSLIIVSPFVTETALDIDRIEAGIVAATRRGVQVRVVSDAHLNRDKAAFLRCVDRLSAAGAIVRQAITQGVHSKMLLVDRAWLVVGSFNWLSAVRDRSSTWARHESSLRYDGNEAFEMIDRSLRDIYALLNTAKA
jgi:hypothetical protein